MESAGVRYLRTRCFCIRNLTRSLRSLVRFLIRQQLVRKYRTPALSMKYSLSTLLTAARMPKFDTAYTEKLEIFYFPTLIFCSFFHNLSESGRESGLPKKNGVSPFI